MARKIYCANCGMELELIHKALPKQHLTIQTIVPHTCPEEHPEFPFKDINNELIIRSREGNSTNQDDLKFIKKINDLNKPSTLSDKRDPDILHKAGAPSGVLEQLDLLKKG